MNNTPPEVIERWRAEFITWMQREHLVKITFDGDSVSVPPINGLGSGRSVPLVAGVAWQAWKEARQSARIELPEPYADEYTSSAFGFNRAVVEAIQSQGYTVNN